MKKSFIIIILLFITSVSFAQVNYRGFVDTGYTFGVGEYGFNQWNINTIHGVEVFHSSLFLGGGIGVGISTENDRIKTYSIPVFADVRYTVSGLKFKPYLDILLSAKSSYIIIMIGPSSDFGSQPYFGYL